MLGRCPLFYSLADFLRCSTVLYFGTSPTVPSGIYINLSSTLFWDIPRGIYIKIWICGNFTKKAIYPEIKKIKMTGRFKMFLLLQRWQLSRRFFRCPAVTLAPSTPLHAVWLAWAKPGHSLFYPCNLLKTGHSLFTPGKNHVIPDFTPVIC